MFIFCGNSEKLLDLKPSHGFGWEGPVASAPKIFQNEDQSPIKLKVERDENQFLKKKCVKPLTHKCSFQNFGMANMKNNNYDGLSFSSLKMKHFFCDSYLIERNNS